MAKTPQRMLNPLFFFDQSQTSRLARSIDWSTHPLGRPEFWPAALKTALKVVFRSRQPMLVFWGPEHICFFNDAYVERIATGQCASSALGQKGPECWPELWCLLEPQINRVLEDGWTGLKIEHRLPSSRKGRVEKSYWTFSYSALTDKDGYPQGVAVSCCETTHTVLTDHVLQSTKGRLSLSGNSRHHLALSS